MWKKIIKLFIIILLYLIVCIVIYEKYTNNPTQRITTTLKDKIVTPIKIEKPIGKLLIPKISLEEELYSINSPNNNIEKHVTILSQSEDPSIENSTMFIAAHSGTGHLAYFKNLDKLSINNEITLQYKNKTYTYIVKDIWEEKKTGTITVPVESVNQLILTTCSPSKDNYQLIINCIIKNKKS